MSLRLGRFGADKVASKEVSPYAGLMRPGVAPVPVPPERFFGLPHWLLYRTSAWDGVSNDSSSYDMLIAWSPADKAFKLVEQSVFVPTRAQGLALVAGVPVYSFTGGATAGIYKDASGASLPDGGALGSASALAAYSHTAVAVQAEADAAAAVADAEAEALQAEADRLAAEGADWRKGAYLVGTIAVPAMLIVRAVINAMRRKK